MRAERVGKHAVLRPEMTRARVPSAFRCGLLICVIKIALATRGFGPTIRLIRRRAQVRPLAQSADRDRMMATERAVAMAGALYPGRALCLEQSLALYYLLRRQGIAVKYCQGAQAYPFAAHAWVEYQGQPLNDIAEHVKYFAKLPDDLA
jgi:hypothetical protein